MGMIGLGWVVGGNGGVAWEEGGGGGDLIQSSQR